MVLQNHDLSRILIEYCTFIKSLDNCKTIDYCLLAYKKNVESINEFKFEIKSMITIIFAVEIIEYIIQNFGIMSNRDASC